MEAVLEFYLRDHTNFLEMVLIGKSSYFQKHPIGIAYFLYSSGIIAV